MTKTFAVLRVPTFLPAWIASAVFGRHWIFWIVGLALAAVLLWQSMKRGDKRLRLAGTVLLGVVVIWAVLGLSFVTPRERLSDAHYRILQAAQHADTNGIMRLLAKRFHYGPLDRTMVREQLQTLFGHLKVHGNTVRKLKITMTGRTATTRFNVFTTTNQGSVLTRWTLRWRDQRRVNNWRMTSATLRSVNNSQVPPGYGFSGNYP